MGKKYIIELEERPFYSGDPMVIGTVITAERLYRVKGFKSLVFDEEGLKRLTPYEESHDRAFIGEIVAGINARRALKAVHGFIMKQEASEITDGVLEIFDQYIPGSER